MMMPYVFIACDSHHEIHNERSIQILAVVGEKYSAPRSLLDFFFILRNHRNGRRKTVFGGCK